VLDLARPLQSGVGDEIAILLCDGCPRVARGSRRRHRGADLPRRGERRERAKGRAAALANARRLVNEAELACKDADSARATSNARAAIELLKYVP